VLPQEGLHPGPPRLDPHQQIATAFAVLDHAQSLPVSAATVGRA
jgi:hypothetical protein